MLTLLDKDHDRDSISHGSFVEFTALLRKNPMIEALEGAIELADFDVFSDKTRTGASRSGNNPSGPKPDLKSQVAPMRKLLALITGDHTLDLVASMNYSNLMAVVPVEIEYFSNKTPAALIDGEFTVLGKVVRVIDESSNDSINLLRGTSFGRFPDERIRELSEAVSKIRAIGLDFPELVTRVTGPAIQVIPIAIFV